MLESAIPSICFLQLISLLNRVQNGLTPSIYVHMPPYADTQTRKHSKIPIGFSVSEARSENLVFSILKC